MHCTYIWGSHIKLKMSWICRGGGEYKSHFPHLLFAQFPVPLSLFIVPFFVISIPSDPNSILPGKQKKKGKSQFSFHQFRTLHLSASHLDRKRNHASFLQRTASYGPASHPGSIGMAPLVFLLNFWPVSSELCKVHISPLPGPFKTHHFHQTN